MAEKKKKSSVLVNTLVLLVVTFVAVLLLAVVNQVTRGPIAQAEINARAEIYKVVYPDAENFAEAEDTDEKEQPIPEADSVTDAVEAEYGSDMAAEAVAEESGQEEFVPVADIGTKKRFFTFWSNDRLVT